MMKKYELDMTVVSNEFLDSRHVLMKLEIPDSEVLFPEMAPGQFVEVAVNRTSDAFLRRPISINFVDREHRQLWLLVQEKGPGTRFLTNIKAGETLNVLFPLGRGFTLPKKDERMLLVGGGVGLAPMLFLGQTLRDYGCEPTFLFGARTASAILERELFERIGPVFVTTEDGSEGEKGFVTDHSVLQSERFDRLAVCGPGPMMLAVARYAKARGIDCEVSLENRMACGLGACLCCVEKTVEGNVCVCKEGPVFNIHQLLWQI